MTPQLWNEENMVSGLVAVFVEAAAVIGGLAGLGCAFWAAANEDRRSAGRDMIPAGALDPGGSELWGRR